jgi:hypothetical protein
MIVLMSLALVVLSGFGLGFVGAFVLRDLWLWFMVPLGLPALSLMHAMGLDLLGQFVVMTRMSMEYESTAGLPKSIVKGLFVTLFIWVAGFVTHYFMMFGW